MHSLSILKPGDSVEIIAPASRTARHHLTELKDLLTSWQLKCLIADDIFGNDLLCANSDDIRLQLLKNAFNHPETKAIICVRGGYGSMRLIPELAKMTRPATCKLFIGMSDITALHLYLQECWQWPVLHSALAVDKFSQESILAAKSILFGEIEHRDFFGIPLNEQASQHHFIETTITGGNLSLIQASIGTLWQIKAKHKIIFLEDVGERGYRIDRMLTHLQQAHIFKDAAAVVFGDFLEGKEPNGSSLIDPVLKRFAAQMPIPVIKIEGVGHGHTNFPLPFGTRTTLQLGNSIQLTTFR